MIEMITPSKTIGILALQGDVEAHQKALEACHATVRLVRNPSDLAQVDALVLPGGESTTISKLMERIGLDTAIKERAEAGMCLFGTCAGLILLAKQIEGRADQPSLGLMDITVARNAFGRQLDSFEADIAVLLESGKPETVHGVFIRAPYVVSTSPEVQIIAHFRDKIVGVRIGNCLGIAFHPELTTDRRIHSYFVEMVAQSTPINP